MTVMTTSGRRFSIGTIILRALQKSGLLSAQQSLTSVNAGQISLAVDTLETIVDDLQTEGVFARSVSFYDLPLVADTYRYDMPTSALDVIGDAMFLPVGTVDATKASGECLVTQVDRDYWQRNTAKDATGQPTTYFCNRQLDTIAVWLNPIPDADHAGTIRFQLHRNLADNTDLDATLDLELYWQGYVIHELASQLAESASMPNDKVSRLAAKAVAQKTKAKATANQRGPNQIVVNHPTGWYGR